METITFEQLPAAIARLYHKVESIERLLQQKMEPNLEADELLTVQQAAVFLKLAVPTLYSLVSKSQVPVSKRRKRLYFSKQELTDWIKAGRIKAQVEIQDEAGAYLQSKQKRG
jgi:excisionase family DNA binding protein